MRKWRILLIGLILIALAYFVFTPHVGPHTLANNETAAVGGLKTIMSTNITWHQQDWDGNEKKDYWTYDVSCLYRISRRSKDSKMGFNLAKADASAAKDNIFKKETIQPWSPDIQSGIPKSGYLFRAMEKDENGEPYNQNELDGVKALNENKFAFVAYPAEYGKTGIRTFIINEKGDVYGADTGSDEKKIILQWPGADQTKVDGPKPGVKWHLAE